MYLREFHAMGDGTHCTVKGDFLHTGLYGSLSSKYCLLLEVCASKKEGISSKAFAEFVWGSLGFGSFMVLDHALWGVGAPEETLA